MSALATIAKAKQSLPLPRLLSDLGLAPSRRKARAVRSTKTSTIRFRFGKTAGRSHRFKCHAGCGDGDEINFLELHEKLSRRDAVKRFLDLAAVTGTL